MNSFPLYIPKETVSDDIVTIIEISVKNGDYIKRDTIVAQIETSKLIFDLISSEEGYFYTPFSQNEKIAVGAIFATLSENTTIPELFLNKPIPNKTKENELQKFSKKALKLIDEHDLNLEIFKHLDFIKEKDVEDYLVSKITVSEFKIDPNNSGNLIMFGGGGHTKMLIDILKQINTYKIYGIADNNYGKLKELSSIPVVSNDDEKNLSLLLKSGVTNATNGVGIGNDFSGREKIYIKLKKIGFSLPNIIHPKAIIEPSVTMGEGNHILAGANIGSSAAIGNNCIISANAIVSHDCVIGNNVMIAPGAILAGRITVGDNTVIGMGVTIFRDASIGSNVIINNGQDVFNSIPDNTKVF